MMCVLMCWCCVGVFRGEAGLIIHVFNIQDEEGAKEKEEMGKGMEGK